MSWRFNPPPGWPRQPAGWAPPPGWTPDPTWPPPPAGWQFWLPAEPPTPTPTPSPVPTQLGPPPMAGPYPGVAGYLGTPGPYPPAPTATAARPWFIRWWGILALVATLLLGGLLGFGGTSLGLSA